MILLIDAGNTRIKLGWLHPATGRREPQPLAIAHDELDRLPLWLEQLPEPPIRAVGVNVAGHPVAAALHDRLPALREDIEWIASQPFASGVLNGYRSPQQLGADRWLALLGLAGHARHLPDVPLLLASFGTATTIDLLGPLLAGETANPDTGAPYGRHRRFPGGLILPGIRLMLTSLANGTANLPLAHGLAVEHPGHTQEAIVSGVHAAQAGALLRQWRIAMETYGHAPLVFASGGAWFDIQPEADRLLRQICHDLHVDHTPARWLPALVLDGLAQLAAQDHRA